MARNLPVRQRPDSCTSKKDQIQALFLSGFDDIADIASMTGCKPSYVGAVLQEAGLHKGYFDLYTSTTHPMNVYSKYFAGQLGYRNEETARDSVELIDALYRRFELAGDRAGQHHALLMALTMYNRARFTAKPTEAEIFRQWLYEHLDESKSVPPAKRAGLARVPDLSLTNALRASLKKKRQKD
jgi:hypothetical protein